MRMKEYRYSIFTDKIEEGINKGLLKPGDKLPSVRAIKKEYNLSISSVQSGYDYLVFKGVVTSVPRSGYIVSDRLAEQNLEVELPIIPRDAVFRKKIHLITNPISDTSQTILNEASPSDLFIPQKLVLKTMQEVIREKGASLLRYYPNNGAEELRDLLVKRAGLHGAFISSDELVVTDGALQALYIALSSITSPNDIIAVESPCIFSILEVIASLKLKTIEIPVRAYDGFDTDYLRKVCATNNIKAIVLTPNFHNPTGILMTEESKKAVYETALYHNVPIIENDVFGCLYFKGSRPSNIRNYDEAGLVMTYSSFSKSLAPGIRLGWLAAGQFFSEAERLKFALGRSVSPINQEVMIKLLQSSAYDKHLRVFRQQLERQALHLVKQLIHSFPDSIHVQLPQGGYCTWVQLPAHIDMNFFYKRCTEEGVQFTPGETFSFTDVYDNCFRAVFSKQLTLHNLEAIRRVGESIL